MAESIANRDEPMPVIRIPSRNDNSSASDDESSPQKKDRLNEPSAKKSDPHADHGTSGLRQSFQERVFASIIAQVIPMDGAPENETGQGNSRSRHKRTDSRKAIERPEFGARLMAANFRRFNARIGIVFVFQNKLIHLFTWRQPTATLSFLAVYSLFSLNPHLLPLLPLCVALFWVMIPAFIARHPTPANDPRLAPDFLGSPTAPPSRVKPAPDLSNDFWRNMRDLQNCMEDFSRLHDATNDYVAPLTNFSYEPISSEIFLGIVVLSSVMFLWSHLIPWSLVLLLSGWIVTLAGHPQIQEALWGSAQSRLGIQSLIKSVCQSLQHWINSDVLLNEPPELREVEVFELQKHHIYTDTWDLRVYSPSPYDQLSPLRMAGFRPQGTPFFQDVQPPNGWTWKEKKWTLDLAAREWVEQRMITGVEIETEGDRWVYDIPRDEDESIESSPTKGSKSKKNASKTVPKSGWGEATGLETRGEWRRRRWVRLVERKTLS